MSQPLPSPSITSSPSIIGNKILVVNAPPTPTLETPGEIRAVEARKRLLKASVSTHSFKRNDMDENGYFQQPHAGLRGSVHGSIHLGEPTAGDSESILDDREEHRLNPKSSFESI